MTSGGAFTRSPPAVYPRSLIGRSTFAVDSESDIGIRFHRYQGIARRLWTVIIVIIPRPSSMYAGSTVKLVQCYAQSNMR